MIIVSNQVASVFKLGNYQLACTDGGRMGAGQERPLAWGGTGVGEEGQLALAVMSAWTVVTLSIRV